MWVCGLKQVSFVSQILLQKVAPYVGVWIETSIRGENPIECVVAPYVGVWIETGMNGYSARTSKSHPMWVCGLKPSRYRVSLQPNYVAPYVGVWIET